MQRKYIRFGGLLFAFNIKRFRAKLWMELLISIFENSSAKGSFRSNKINYEILQLSADSRYLQSGPLK